MMEKTISHDPQRTWIVAKTAAIHGVSKRYVYMVIKGEKENDAVFATYMDLLEGSNDLLKAVEQLVPFSTDSTTAA